MNRLNGVCITLLAHQHGIAGAYCVLKLTRVLHWFYGEPGTIRHGMAWSGTAWLGVSGLYHCARSHGMRSLRLDSMCTLEVQGEGQSQFVNELCKLSKQDTLSQSARASCNVGY